MSGFFIRVDGQNSVLPRLPPGSTPPLPGEVFEYTPVPEPSENAALTILSLSALLSLRLKQRRKIRGKDKAVSSLKVDNFAIAATNCKNE